LLDYEANVLSWYKAQTLVYGLVVPIATADCIVLDCIDRVDAEKKRFRTNVYGWFTLAELAKSKSVSELSKRKNL